MTSTIEKATKPLLLRKKMPNNVPSIKLYTQSNNTSNVREKSNKLINPINNNVFSLTTTSFRKKDAVSKPIRATSNNNTKLRIIKVN